MEIGLWEVERQPYYREQTSTMSQMGENKIFISKPYVTQFYTKKCVVENLESKIYKENRQ